MVHRVELVRLPAVVDEQAVAQAEQMLESGVWRGLLRRLAERVGDSPERGNE